MWSLNRYVSKQNTLLNSLILVLTLFATNTVHANEAALKSALAQHSFLLDIDNVDNTFIAVGERGHILVSSDNANTWQQASVPTRSTLTASYFVNKNKGWAVGHDGIVLTTDDAGQHWQIQLTGEQANQLNAQYLKTLLEKKQRQFEQLLTEQRNEEAEIALENLTFMSQDADSFIDEGASRPFLDVWFKNEQEGFVIGAFGLFFRTIDGGQSWQPWLTHLPNTDGLHLNSIKKIGNALYIVAEAGTLFRSDDQGETWQILNSPYDGTFFGIEQLGNNSNSILAYGLRGNAFYSKDQGEHWQKINTSIDASLFGSTRLTNGDVVLVGHNGFFLTINTNGQRTTLQQTVYKLPITNTIYVQNKGLISTGFLGIQPLSLSPKS